MNSRFLDACRRRPTDVRPVWFMRQAGRYMKSYRDIRAKHGMLEICKRPDLAAAITGTVSIRFFPDSRVYRWKHWPTLMKPGGNLPVRVLARADCMQITAKCSPKRNRNW